MSKTFFASKEALIEFNDYNKATFNHGYSLDEFEDLDDKTTFPVTNIQPTRKDKEHRVFQFALNEVGKFCIFYLNEKTHGKKLSFVEVPKHLVN